MSVQKEIKKITTNTLQRMKQHGEKISMITAYDFSFAKIFYKCIGSASEWYPKIDKGAYPIDKYPLYIDILVFLRVTSLLYLRRFLSMLYPHS